MKKKYFIFLSILFFVLISSVNAEELNCYYNLSGLSSTLQTSTINNGDLTYTRQALRIHNTNSKDSNGKYVWDPTFSIGKYGCDNGQAASASNNYCGFTETTSNFAFFDLNSNVTKYTNSDMSYAFNNVSSANVASTSGVNSAYTKCPSTITVGLNKYSISDPNIKYYIFSVSSDPNFKPDGVNVINYSISKFTSNNGTERINPSQNNTSCASEIRCKYNNSAVNVEVLVLNNQLINVVKPVSNSTRYDSSGNYFVKDLVTCPSDSTKFKCPEAIYYTENDVIIADNGYGAITAPGVAYFRYTEAVANGYRPVGNNVMIPLTSSEMNPQLRADERATYLTTNGESSFNDPYNSGASQSSSQTIDVTPGGGSSSGSNRTTPTYDYVVEDDFKFCDEVSVLRTLDVVRIILLIVRIIIPLTLIILASIDLFKAVTGGDSKAMKDSLSIILRRTIIGVIIFFIPTIVNSFIVLIDKNADEDQTFSKCTICFTGKEGNCSDIIESLKNS